VGNLITQSVLIPRSLLKHTQRSHPLLPLSYPQTMALRWLLALAAAGVASADYAVGVQQIHLAQGKDPSTMVVSWLTPNDSATEVRDEIYTECILSLRSIVGVLRLASVDYAGGVQQIHLAQGKDPSSMVVSWLTPNDSATEVRLVLKDPL
jgi:hypothetical protein